MNTLTYVVSLVILVLFSSIIAGNLIDKGFGFLAGVITGGIVCILVIILSYIHQN